MEIVKFVLSVMGLTWANIRVKLVKATNETTVKVLETGFDIVKTLVTQGPAAAWQKIVETLTNLKQMAIDAVMDFVKSKVVEAAVTKLLSMLSPAGAVIQAIIAIYNTVMFFVERIKQIAAVAASFIDSIATIASGNIGPAANRVEQTMAGLLTLVISFLARVAGLGKVSDAVIGLVNKIRAPIDKALDKVVIWIVETAKKLGKMLLGGGKAAKDGPDTRTPEEKKRDLHAAIQGATAAMRRPGITRQKIAPILAKLREQYRLRRLEAESAGKDKWDVIGEVNPIEKSDPVPEAIDEEKALALLLAYRDKARKGPAGSLSFTVTSVSVAKTLLGKVFRHAPKEWSGPGPWSAPAGKIESVKDAKGKDVKGQYKFSEPLGDGPNATKEQKEQKQREKDAYRELQKTTLLYHVDVSRFSVPQIADWFAREKIQIAGVIETHEAAINSGRTIPGKDPNYAIDISQKALVEARRRSDELKVLETNFNAKIAVYKDLEERKVLYGHEMLPPDHHHKTNPHINVAGHPEYVSPEDAGPEIDVTIYIAEK